MRWKNNITKHAGTKWMEKADDRGEWSQMEEAYIQCGEPMAENDDAREKSMQLQSRLAELHQSKSRNEAT